MTAARIKEILVETARPGPEQLGGGILAIEQAVLKVINEVRAAKNLPALTPEMLENMGVIDAVATSTDQPNVYSVKGILMAVPDEGTQVTIAASAGATVDGDTTQTIAAVGEVDWPKVTVTDDKVTIAVTRKDSGASSVITFQSYDINESWSGTYTVTEFTVDDPEAAQNAGSNVGCSLALLDALKGKPLPMTMDVTVDESGKGTALMLIDVSSLNTGNEGEGTFSSEPQSINIQLSGNTVTFQLEQSQGGVGSMSGAVSRQGDGLVMNGTMTCKGTGFSMAAVWAVTQG